MSVLVRLLTAAALCGAALVALPSTASAAPPPRPVVRAVSPTADAVTFTWQGSPQAVHYRACLRRTATQVRCDVRSAKVTATTISFRGLTPADGDDYHASVTAYNADGSATSATKAFELAVAKPATPTGVAAAVTARSATITWKAAKNAQSYDVCLTRSGSETTCWRTSPRSSTTSARFDDLVPTGGLDYFATVRAHRGSATSSAAPARINLPVDAVRGVVVGTVTPRTMALSWTATRNAETYQVEVATSSDMKKGLRTLTTKVPAVTVGELTPGARHHVRVRGVNSPLTGARSAVVTRSQPTDAVGVRVATWNLCGQDKCYSTATASTVPRWSKRKAAAGKLIRATGATIISTQESGDKDTNFITQLPGFRRAAYRSAKSLFYRTDRYDLNRAGTVTLDAGRKRYAVWAELEHKTTGTPFIVVDPHLEPYKGASKDRVREAQTRTLLAHVAKVNRGGLPVVYAGDFNSNKNNADQSKYKGGYDGVLKAFTAAGVANSLAAATRAGVALNPTYNSANQGRRDAIRNSDHVDAIYVTPGIGVADWRVVVDLVSPTRYRTPFASDHNPVRADLVIPGLEEKP